MTKKLYVGNLSFSTTEQDLQKLFTEIGPVTSVAVITDRYPTIKRLLVCRNGN